MVIMPRPFLDIRRHIRCTFMEARMTARDIIHSETIEELSCYIRSYFAYLWFVCVFKNVSVFVLRGDITDSKRHGRPLLKTKLVFFSG